MLSENKSDILVLGIGNTLLRDEGAGIHLLAYLQNHYSFEPSVNFIDGGTFGLDLLPYFEDHKKVIILDAVNFGLKPGSVKSLRNGEITTLLQTKMSSHSLGLADVLAAKEMLNVKNEEIVLVGLQPDSVEAGLKMSEALQNSMNNAMDIVLQILEDWDVRIHSKQSF